MIEVLDSAVIDKIAAGEVLERPAQLVKELVENSLDAGATEVEVEVSEGGRGLLVKDNGGGIPQGQLEVALKRHATSKIRQVEDLFRLSSFGFRGEALSSAASVSELTLKSRVPESPIGYRIESQFGNVSKPLEVSSSVGSEVSVSKLFENVPARLKFLKSNASEWNQIKQVVKSFGLSRPDVSFKLSKEGELQFFWPQGQNPRERAQEILGVDALYETSGEENQVEVRAYYGAPNKTLRQNRGLWLFVQGRFVQDRAMGAAVMEAYRNLLMHGEYPHCVLFLNLPADQVDVNVHPTKSQVRFADSSKVFRAVVHVLREALEKTPWLEVQRQQQVKSLELEFSQEEPQAPDSHSQMTFLDRELKRTRLQNKEFKLKDSGSRVQLEDLQRARDLEISSSVSPAFESSMEDTSSSQTVRFRWSDLQVLGQMAQTYILAQSDEEFFMVDQHAAHERVVFERLMKNFKDGNIPQQSFLLPLSLDFPQEDLENLLAAKEDLEKMGVCVEQAGPQTLAITSIPEVIKESGVVRALEVFAEQLSRESGSFAVERAIADIFASMSCHSVVRAGQALSKEEMVSLLEQMDEFPFSSFCPHGRPVYVKKSFSQIDREFGRTL